MSNPLASGAPDVAPAPGALEPPRLRRDRRAAWRRQFLADGPVDVTVCIVNWNCRELLRACLESLHDREQGVTLETVVVDNASTDGAAEMVADEFPEVVLVRNDANRGFARANNQAARRARGRYLFFLNNDTVVPPGTLRKLLDYAEAHPAVGMIGPRLRDGEGRYQVSYRQQPTVGTLLHRTSLVRCTGLLRGAYRSYRREEFDPHTTRTVEVLMGAALFLSRERFFGCGGWDEGFTFGGEDLDLSVRVRRQGELVYLPEAEVTHYGRASTRQHIGYASAQMMIGFARYLRKTGCPQPLLALYKLIVTLDAPVQLVGKGLQCLWRRLRGHPKEARKSWLALRGFGHFLLRGLGAFWRA
jgi:N-acetylglucosaminyl-diphospho-decaprenol L-rhamnosyltransferase